MDIALSDEHRAIDENVSRICARFNDAYWTECDQTPRFPEEFHQAMAEAGWLGITMPTELGGAGLGVTEAAIMMHAVTRGGGGFSAACRFRSPFLYKSPSQVSRLSYRA